MLIEENDECLGGGSYQSSILFNNSMPPSVLFFYTTSIFPWLFSVIANITSAFHVTENPQSENVLHWVSWYND